MASRLTARALLARGVDSQLADAIVQQGFTLARLKQMATTELEALGLSAHLIPIIQEGNRPPIPGPVLTKALYESRRTCCVCRESSRPIVIHHIVPWAESKSHKENNLAVLCLEHHSEAHTKRELALSLSPDQLRETKRLWLDRVKNHDALSILGIAQVDGANWDYFNHRRLFEIVTKLTIDPSMTSRFTFLRSAGILDKFGFLAPQDSWRIPDRPSSYLYQFQVGTHLYLHVKELIEAALPRLPIIDLTSRWNRAELSALLRPGTFIACQGAYYFKRLVSSKAAHQPRLVYRRADGIRLAFQINAWESTSMSSWSYHLAGRRVATAISIARSVSQSDGELAIDASCLAIGSFFQDTRQFPERLWRFAAYP